MTFLFSCDSWYLLSIISGFCPCQLDCLSACLSICPSAYCPSVCPSVYFRLSVNTISLYAWYIRLSVHLSICLPLLTVYPYTVCQYCQSARLYCPPFLSVLSVCPYCLSVCQYSQLARLHCPPCKSVLSVYPYCLSVCTIPTVHLSIPTIRLSVPTVCLSVCPSVLLSVRPVYPYCRLSYLLKYGPLQHYSTPQY